MYCHLQMQLVCLLLSFFSSLIKMLNKNMPSSANNILEIVREMGSKGNKELHYWTRFFLASFSICHAHYGQLKHKTTCSLHTQNSPPPCSVFACIGYIHKEQDQTSAGGLLQQKQQGFLWLRCRGVKCSHLLTFLCTQSLFPTKDGSVSAFKTLLTVITVAVSWYNSLYVYYTTIIQHIGCIH